ncbi:glycosyl transferase, partial [Lactarius pseudohatsudake]
SKHRILFFTQLLTTALPEALPVDAMPDYKKVCIYSLFSASIDCVVCPQDPLSLWEIIKESDINTCVTLLEYSKQLHGLEWENFIRDTKILAQELEMYDG